MRNVIAIEIDTARESRLRFLDRAPADYSMHDAMTTSEPREARHV